MGWKRRWCDTSIIPVNEEEARKQTERERKGRGAYQIWLAIRQAQRAAGQNISDADLRPWEELKEHEREIYRRGAESITIPEAARWAMIAKQRQAMGEKAFRKKVFEICIDLVVEGICPGISVAEKYRAVDGIVKLSGMLEVPAANSGDPPLTGKP